MGDGGRTGDYLKERYRQILHYCGLILLLSGVILFLPLISVFAYPGEIIYIKSFIIPAFSLMFLGLILWRFFYPSETIILNIQEGGVIVLVSWLLVMIFSSWPFMKILDLNFTLSFFEAVSGWTTTGLTVVDVTETPHVLLMWRSIMQFAGGAGFAIIMLTTIAGPVGSGMSIAEGRGSQLVPHVKESARRVIGIYTGYVLAGVIAYWIAGMNIFDAVNHSFTSVSTGGFSTHPESIGYWNSPAIEAVSIPLMLLGSMNFLTAYLLFSGRIKAVFRNSEIKFVLFIVPVSILLLYFTVGSGIYTAVSRSIRIAIYETITAVTTTGFTSTNYANWTPFGFFIITILMVIGGGTGSTAGGIKQYRIYLIFKSIWWNIKRQFLPKTAIVQNYIWRGEKKYFVDNEHIKNVVIFASLYIVIFVLGSGIIAAHGFSLKNSFFEFASAVGTVGLSTGITSPQAPAGVLWTETIGMFLGRLEFMVIIVSLGKIFKDSWLMMEGEKSK